MTQDVRITDLTGIPQWATEVSLGRIEKLLQDKFGIHTSDNQQNQKNQKDQTTALQDIEKRLEDLLNEAKQPDLSLEKYEELGKELAGLEKTQTKLSQDTNKLNNNLKTTGTGFIGALFSDATQLGGMFGRINQQLNVFHTQRFPNIARQIGGMPKIFGGPLLALGLAFGLLGKGIGQFVRLLQDSTKVQRDFFEIGVGGFRGIGDFYFQLSRIGATSAEFAEIVQGAATAVGTFGIDAIPRITGSLDNLEQLGLTSATAAKFVAENLQQQRLAGLYGLQTGTQQQQSMQRSIQQLTAFSQILNVSRQEIQKTVTEMLEQDQIRAALMRLEDGKMRTAAADGLKTVVGLFAAMGEPGKKFAGLFGDMVGALDPLMVEGLYDFMPFAGQATMELADLARGIRAGRIGEDKAAVGMVNFAQALEKQSGMITYMAGYGDQSARQAAAFLAQWREATSRLGDISGLSNREIAERLQNRQQELTKEAQAMIRLDDATRKIRTTFIATLAAFFEGLTKRFGGIDDLVKRISIFLEVITARLQVFLEGYIDKLSKGEITIGETLAGFAGAIAGAFMDGIRTWVDMHGGFILKQLFGTPKKEIDRSDPGVWTALALMMSGGVAGRFGANPRMIYDVPSTPEQPGGEVQLQQSFREVRRRINVESLNSEDRLAAQRAIVQANSSTINPEELKAQRVALETRLRDQTINRQTEQTKVLSDLVEVLEKIERHTRATATNTD